MKLEILTKLALFAGVAFAAATVNAIPIGSTGTLNSLPVNASGTLSAGSGIVTVTLNNLQADPKSVIQLISGVSFDVTGASGSGLLTSASVGNTVITIGAGGAYTSPVSDPLTRWTATETGTSIYLTTLSGGNPDRLIIGPPNGSNLYANANASITGDNPSVFESATFVINVPGVTQNSIFANPVIYFGTGPDTVTHVPDGGTTVLLLGTALAAMGMVARRVKA